MKAIRFDGAAARLVADLPDPVPGPGEALVRPIRLGVCSTDLEVLSGLTNFVGVMGHEFIGVVEDVNVPSGGPLAGSAALAARKKWKGRRVVADINIVCGACDLCKGGLRSHCRNRSVIGCAGRDGVFAERVVLPAANLHAVPDGVDDDHAVFAEPLAAAAHVAQQVRAEGRQFVTVLGDGKLGLLVAQVLGRGNPMVRLLGKHPEKFGLCEKWGIKHRHIDEVGRRQDQDVVIDCTGSPSGLALAMQLVRPRGKIVLKSAVSPVPMAVGAPAPLAKHPAWAQGVNLAPLVINEIDLLGSRCGPIEAALDLLAGHAVQVLPMITRRMRLTDGPSIFDAARTKGQIKVVVEA